MAGWVPEGAEEIDDRWEPPGDWSDSEWGVECVYRHTDTAGLRWERLNRESPQRILEEAPV
jgi:hypothetical protein